MANKCPICNNENTSLFIEGLTDMYYDTTKDLFDLWECKNCEAKFQHPFIHEEVVRKYYKSGNYKPYQLNLKPISLKWKNSPHSIYLRKLKQRHSIKDKFSLVDLGCGGGSFLLSVKHYFPNATVVGIDISEESISNLKKYDIQGYSGSLYDFKSVEKFDYITSSQVLEHLNHPYNFLKTLLNLSTKNTIIMIDVPAADSFSARKFGRFWTHWDLPRHSILFTIKSITKLFEGFETSQIIRAGSFVALVSSFKLKIGKNVFKPIVPFETFFVNAISTIGRFFNQNYLFDDKLIWIGKIK